MNINQINQLIDEAYEAALLNPTTVARHYIFDNVSLQTDIYTSPYGDGFRIVCIISDNEGRFIMRVKNHGPDILSEIEWPNENIETALQNSIIPFWMKKT